MAEHQELSLHAAIAAYKAYIESLPPWTVAQHSRRYMNTPITGVRYKTRFATRTWTNNGNTCMYEIWVGFNVLNAHGAITARCYSPHSFVAFKNTANFRRGDIVAACENDTEPSSGAYAVVGNVLTRNYGNITAEPVRARALARSRAGQPAGQRLRRARLVIRNAQVAARRAIEARQQAAEPMRFPIAPPPPDCPPATAVCWCCQNFLTVGDFIYVHEKVTGGPAESDLRALALGHGICRACRPIIQGTEWTGKCALCKTKNISTVFSLTRQMLTKRYMLKNGWHESHHMDVDFQKSCRRITMQQAQAMYRANPTLEDDRQPAAAPVAAPTSKKRPRQQQQQQTGPAPRAGCFSPSYWVQHQARPAPRAPYIPRSQYIPQPDGYSDAPLQVSSPQGVTSRMAPNPAPLRLPSRQSPIVIVSSDEEDS